MSYKKETITRGLFWNLMERWGVQFTQFVLQLILARILSPEHYGTLQLMVVFTTLANVFIQTGFSSALIQNKEVTDEDFSSVFWLTLGIAVIIYVGFFFAAPLIAAFYKMPELVAPFRVLSLVLLPGALNSVQLARIKRRMDFKKIFRSNVAAIIIAGLVGILLACMGAGIWALVAQTLTNTTVACIVMWFSVKWQPRFVFNTSRVKILFAFGWKLLVSHLLETLYQDIQSLIIGKKFNSGTLGYYTRGKQFPHLLINSINSAVQNVMLPAMSADQDNKAKVKSLMRNSISLSSYIIFPMMAGLAGVAEPMVKLLLTEKWLPCVPYLQICCFCYAFYPIHSCNLQAINAVGRSDVYLKLEIIKKIYGVLVLVAAIVFFDSAIELAMSGIVISLISTFVNASPNKKLVDYSYLEQLRDILPAFVLSFVMLAVVLLIGTLKIHTLALLALQIAAGVAIYVGLSAALRLPPFIKLLGFLKKILKKRM